ncbi:MAG: DUF1877 family protein [Deltaproteobacteria bacterium]|nr:DUF1877 family protein [Deltaproteobacteria bacterium]
MSANVVLVCIDDGDLAWLRESAEAAFVLHPTAVAYELEGAFAGIHYLLSGHAPAGPLGFIADLGVGQLVPRQFPAGPGRVLSPALLADIARGIESLSVGVVRARLDSDVLRSLDPFAGHPFGDDEKEWLLAVLQGLMTFIRKAADAEVSVLVVPL